METQRSCWASCAWSVELVGIAALALVAGTACASNKSPGGGDAGRGSGGSSGSGNSGSGGGTHTPDVRIDGIGGGTADVSVQEGNLGTDKDGQVLWLLTLVNESSSPISHDQFSAKLFDAQGALLAGSEPGLVYLEDGVPSFNGFVTGRLYLNGPQFLDSCLPPNGRGLGRGYVQGQSPVLLSEEDVARILEQTARIEYTLYLGAAVSPDIQPADDVLTFEGVALGDSSAGKVVRGTAVAGANLVSWEAQIVLWDSQNRIVDFASANGNALAEGARVDFETTPVKSTVASLETFAQARLQITR
jgi:hypothetical protein